VFYILFERNVYQEIGEGIKQNTKMWCNTNGKIQCTVAHKRKNSENKTKTN